MSQTSELFEIESDGPVVLRVFVQPGASRAGVVGRHGDALKVRVSAPAEAGKANAAVVDLLADALGLRAADVELISGAGSRHKRFRFHNLSAARLAQWLDQVLGP